MVMKKPKKILMLGSGALKIGEAGEFDYSGSQGLKAFKEEGIRTVLVNPNIATIQTSPLLADEIYFLPVTPEFVARVIEKERPDAIALSFGGQTALNCGLALEKSGILRKHKVKVLGTPTSAIELTEDREKFAQHLRKMRIPVPPSGAARDLAAAEKIARRIGFPLMVRAAFALGGQKSGVAHDLKEFREIARGALAVSPQVLVEKYLHHYKEIEYEVVRDRADNCVTVCNMENMDPLGIHTGESVVVAPSQTLTNREYHGLREVSIRIVRSLGIVGECNVQFALNPNPKPGTLSPDFYVIEVNARLSRSSALASKATGYPLAYVAAKLALGKLMTQVPNQITKVTTSFFEPAMDYVVVKIPRWDIEKFRGAEERIGSAMKSVGEVMAIGRTFEEALQKGVRMLGTGQELAANGFSSRDLDRFIDVPTPRRLFALAAALKKGKSVEEIARRTGIDPWFLDRIRRIARLEKEIGKKPFSRELLLTAKQAGFSDARIASLRGETRERVRAGRLRLGIRPSAFQIDTLAGEVPARTNYLYLTYNGAHHDVRPIGRKGVMVLGSGPYRIGSSVEFDWSAVHAAMSLKRFGKSSIIVNCNPETVSTDYDVSDRLYFENVDIETVLDIYEFENAGGIIVSVGGQASQNLARGLAAAKARVLGTRPEDINRAEDRGKFSALLDKLGIAQPPWESFASIEAAKRFAAKVGYPVLVRPSYVLSGSAMSVCMNDSELNAFAAKAAVVSREYPVVVSKFIEGAQEIEFDGVAQEGRILISAIAEHVEFAGVHSGDATIVYPAPTLTPGERAKITASALALVRALRVTGPLNIQFLVKDGGAAVIEMNVRASRTFPLLSKASGVNFAEEIVAAFYGKGRRRPMRHPRYVIVKSPQFSFSRLTGADPVLHVEMASTGEVAAFGTSLHEALLTSVLASTSFKEKPRAALLSIGGEDNKRAMLDAAEMLHAAKFKIYATEGTAEHLTRSGIPAIPVHKTYEKGRTTALSLIEDKKVSFVVNVSDKEGSLGKKALRATDGYLLRRAAVDRHLPLITDLNLARAFLTGLKRHPLSELPVRSWGDYLGKK